MVNKEIKRLGIPIIIAWVLCGGYFYELFDNRDLFEYITYLLIGIYISSDIKTKWKYLLIIILAQNVIEESIMIMGDDGVNIMTSMWIKGAVVSISTLVISLFRSKGLIYNDSK